MKCTFILTGLLLFGSSLLLAQTALAGQINDAEGHALYGANIVLFKRGVLITGTASEDDGHVELSGLNPGIYDIQISYLGHEPKSIRGFKMFAGKQNWLYIELIPEPVNLNSVVVTAPKPKYLDHSNGCSTWVWFEKPQKAIPTPPSSMPDIHYYPNPATEVVTVELTQPLKTLQVYTASGQMIAQYQNLSPAHFRLRVDQWPTGTYFLRCMETDRQVTLPLIVE
ncbi:T9SS type A sorting domain-containing protein [Phaeodactylibacter sp.]|uniref:T9SS type A sorting domain-containing protein n=1 Tax=Phaeodactylibacter sp. TaxID=1940289 RepID=UPI0025F873EC|nr:T9SS type A sorting domain-containing protein [Phaeodactylibacter sp.]MCI4650488.1 T9SS type A sorting domain-containing protein [Phaeodactylibacter sp.]MCI5092563.1 T9SS type A sorting domain-containing protein [Phaeodactylibacter sp.]